jgi:hypothetical protein
MQGSGTETAHRFFQHGTLVALLGGLAAMGCGKSEECQRARLEASKAWQAVAAQAGEAELKGPPGFEELSEAQKAEHVKQWSELEKQSGMVSSSFTYEKITWKTAEPAREKTNALFNGYSAKSDFVVFTASLKTANQKFDETAKLCKD